MLVVLAHVFRKFSNEFAAGTWQWYFSTIWVDFAVIGAPVINFISCYYTTDIPDWSLDESGIGSNFYADKKMDKTIINSKTFQLVVRIFGLFTAALLISV